MASKLCFSFDSTVPCPLMQAEYLEDKVEQTLIAHERGLAMNQLRKTHWEDVYRTTAAEELGWYQAHPTMSLNLIQVNRRSKDRKPHRCGRRRFDAG